MKNIKNLYISNEYVKNNPTLHEEDSDWKMTKILPLINKFVNHINKKEINLLDVGGGAGLILKLTSEHLKKNHKIKVNKYSLDLTPKMLKIQKKNNPDIKKLLNEDITKTSLKDKEIDITLLIDVLEHVPNPENALKELERISNYVILKVPLENNILTKLFNFITLGKSRKNIIKTMGHINRYNYSCLKKQIEKSNGKIEKYYYTNVFEYYNKSEYTKDKKKLENKFLIKNYYFTKNIHKLYCTLGNILFKLSPRLCAHIFNDFVMVLVKY